MQAAVHLDTKDGEHSRIRCARSSQTTSAENTNGQESLTSKCPESSMVATVTDVDGELCCANSRIACEDIRISKQNSTLIYQLSV